MQNLCTNKNIIFHSMEDGGVLNNSEKDEVHIINELGVLVWENMFENHHSFEQTVQIILEKYDLKDAKQIKTDVYAFLLELIDKEILYEQQKNEEN